MALFELHPGRKVGLNYPCYVIAEVGQNHQGSIDIAMELIKTAARSGCDCVKFQKSYLTEKFNKHALNRPYQSKHSFGSTYGEHKAAIDLTDEQFHQLQRYAINEGIQFTASAMDCRSVDFLVSLGVPFIKIGSGDTNNYKLINKITGVTDKPIILSTGMHNLEIIEKSVELIKPESRPLCLLHCISSYPTPTNDVHLNVIKLFQRKFPSSVVGYSGHETGWEISLAAVALGAKVLERHLTLNHNMKGNDHQCSLEPDEMSSLISKVRFIETSLGEAVKLRRPSEEACYNKLGKSIVSARNIKKGETIDESMLDVKVAEPRGIEAHHFYNIIGRVINQDLEADETIQFDHLI